MSSQVQTNGNHQNQMLIGGAWVKSGDGKTQDVINPTTGEAFAQVPAATTDDAQAALDAAQKAQPAWAAMTPLARAAYYPKIARLVRDNGERLARLITQEEGKPISESRVEVEWTAGFFDYYAGFARAQSGEIYPSDNEGEEVWIRKVPFGVVLGITPWNFPLGQTARKVAPALMAGNTIVVKPSADTPLCAIALAELMNEAGVPGGVVNVVTGSGKTIGDYLVRSPVTQMVSLTGSVGAGKKIMEAAIENITVVSLELGGKAPFIVLDDADVDNAVRHAITARFQNNGQVCTCNERTYVHSRVYDNFIEKYVAAASKLRVGDPMKEDTDVGPKVSQPELEKVEQMVQNASKQGAEIALGGKRPEGKLFEKGFWFEPTILTNVRNDMEIIQDEIFGPVSPVMAFDDFEQAVSLANDSKFGLSAYIFTNDVKRMMRAVQHVNFGEIYVNKIGPEQLQGFHTGHGLSGMGGDDGKHGLDHYSRRRTVYVSYREETAAHLMPYGKNGKGA